MSEAQAAPVSTQTAPAATPEVAVPDEKATPELPEKPKEDLDLSSRFAALTKKERMLMHKQREFDEKSKGLEAVAKYEEAKKNAKQNPIAYLESLGLSYKEITDYILNDNKPTTEGLLGSLQQQIADLHNQLSEKEKAEKNAKIDHTIDQFKSSIRNHVDTNADAFELIQANDAYDLVFQVAEQVFNDTGEVPEIADCAKHIEAQLEKESEKLLTLKKIKAKLAAAQPPEPVIPPDAKLAVASKTLTNASVSSTPDSTKKMLSDDESRKRAAAMLKWS